MCMIPLCSVGMFMSSSETEDARKTSKSNIIVYMLWMTLMEQEPLTIFTLVLRVAQ